ncbi:MAG: ABC transporter substrate-binding protein [Promethearchaeota archaeon]|jgi:branched-chain amino acid transport system substrate-binding protein
MEAKLKRILAIVLVVVIVIGIGIPVALFFFAPYRWSSEDAPGAPAGLTPEQIIKIGVLGGINDIQGEGAVEGAELAAKEINEGGGVVVGGNTYYVGITSEDTDESNPNLDVTKGVAAAERLIDYKNVQFALGGFRSEALLAYQEVIMDAKIPFLGTGASTDIFCQNVLDNYARYKYFFRNMPINSTSLAKEILTTLLFYFGYLNATNPENIHKYSLLYEDLTWTAGMVAFLKAYLTGTYGYTLATEIAYPITATQTQMDGYMSQLDGNNTQLLIPLISAQGGILMMNSYATVEPGFVVIGIDVQSQLETFWTDTSGNCAYETILQSLHATNKTDKSIPFWNAFKAEYGHEPLYTAVGSYDAVNLIVWAIEQSQSFSANTIVTQLETLDRSSPLDGAGGQAAFTNSHDVVEGYPYGYTLFVQWNSTGGKAVVSTGGLVYPDTIVTGPYQTPIWPGWSFNA